MTKSGITSRKYIVFSLFCLAFSLTGFPAHAVLDRAQKAGFAPHKALYKVSMETRKNGGQVANVAGQMFYEWKTSCDAWISNHRYDVLYEYADAPSMRIKSDFSTYEAFDGESLSFTSQKKRGGNIFEELRGNAKIKNDKSEAVYSMPPDLVFELPKGSLFPMAHTLDVIEKIKQGKKFYKATIFDGSDKDGPVDINTFIGKPFDTAGMSETLEDADKALLETKAWKLRLAFFPVLDSQSTADYEMDLVFHENGVISDMTIEYEDFSIRQKLVAIEPMEDACEDNKEGKD